MSGLEFTSKWMWHSISQNLQNSELQALRQSVMYLTRLHHALSSFLLHVLTSENNLKQGTQLIWRHPKNMCHSHLFYSVQWYYGWSFKYRGGSPDESLAKAGQVIQNPFGHVVPVWASIQRPQLWMHNDCLTLQNYSYYLHIVHLGALRSLILSPGIPCGTGSERRLT